MMALTMRGVDGTGPGWKPGRRRLAAVR